MEGREEITYKWIKEFELNCRTGPDLRPSLKPIYTLKTKPVNTLRRINSDRLLKSIEKEITYKDTLEISEELT